MNHSSSVQGDMALESRTRVRARPPVSPSPRRLHASPSLSASRALGDGSSTCRSLPSSPSWPPQQQQQPRPSPAASGSRVPTISRGKTPSRARSPMAGKPSPSPSPLPTPCAHQRSGRLKIRRKKKKLDELGDDGDGVDPPGLRPCARRSLSFAPGTAIADYGRNAEVISLSSSDPVRAGSCSNARVMDMAASARDGAASFPVLSSDGGRLPCMWNVDERANTDGENPSTKFPPTKTVIIICKRCDREGEGSRMLLCDECESAFHLECVSCPVTSLTEDDWYCATCIQKPTKHILFASGLKEVPSSRPSNADPTKRLPAHQGRTKHAVKRKRDQSTDRLSHSPVKGHKDVPKGCVMSSTKPIKSRKEEVVVLDYSSDEASSDSEDEAAISGADPDQAASATTSTITAESVRATNGECLSEEQPGCVGHGDGDGDSIRSGVGLSGTVGGSGCGGVLVVDGQIYADPLEHLTCVECRRGDGEDEMLICDKCERGFHMYCLCPILVAIPPGDWFCPKCCKRPVVKEFPMIQTRIVDFFRIARPLTTQSPSGSKRIRRQGRNTFKYQKKRRALLPHRPSSDPVRRLEQMASLATALTSAGVQFSDSLTYLPGLAPRSSNRAKLETGGMQVLPKNSRDAYDQCKEMTRSGECAPLLVRHDEKQGFVVEAADHIPDLTIIAEYTGDVDFMCNRENDPGDSIMGLLFTGDPNTELVICPDKRGNVARFLSGINNHNKDGRKKINVRCVRFDLDGEALALLIAIRDIRKGDFLYYDYNGLSRDGYPTHHFV